MSGRGARFALGRPPSRDAQGRSLPSHRSVQFCELRLLCRCGSDKPLAEYFVYTHYPVFPGDVNEWAPGKGIVERQWIEPEDGRGYVRYKFACRCGNRPVLRQHPIDDLLRKMYEPGAVMRSETVRI